MNRRTLIGLAGGGALAGIAGCLDFVRGNEPLEIGAGQVRVPDDVVEETGYEFVGTNEFVVEEEVEAMGQSRDVIATNIQTEYERTVDVGPLGSVEGAVFSAVTTPSVSVLGQEFNPLGGMDTDDLVEMVQNRYDRVQDIEHVEDVTRRIHEQDVTVGVYRAEATLMGQGIDVSLHISEAVDFDDDLAIAVGTHPEIMSDESEKVYRLMESLAPVE